MATIKTYTMTEDELNAHLTRAMQVTFSALIADGKVTDDYATEFCDTHACQLAHRGGFFNRWIERFSPDLKPDHAAFVITKVVS